MNHLKKSQIDIARNLYWYDLTYYFLNDFHDIKTHDAFSNYFHEGLDIDSDSNFFWKLRQGRTTLGEKWLKRIEEKEPMSLSFYQHFLWKILKKHPTDAYEIIEIIRTLPHSLTSHFFLDDEVMKLKIVQKTDLINIKEMCSLDSLGFLYLLNLYGRSIYNLDLINSTVQLIFQSLESVSLQPGLERVHILLFDIITSNLFEVILNGYCSPIYIQSQWRTFRDSDWSSDNCAKSQNSEKKLIKDKLLSTKLITNNTEFENFSKMLLKKVDLG